MTTTTAAEALLLVETADGIATLTLNRPAQFNALSGALIDELQSALDRMAGDPAVRVVVLAARGRGFCAGHDLKELRAMGDVAEVEALFARCSRMMMTHRAAAAAGDREGARPGHRRRLSARGHVRPGRRLLGRHLRHARRQHRRLLLHSRRGARPGGGPKHAMEMLLTGEAIGRRTRARIGLVNRVVAPEALDAEVDVAGHADRVEVAGGHRHGQAGVLPPARDAARRGVRVGGHAIACDFVGDDGKEGVEAFLGKRTPRWADRKY